MSRGATMRPDSKFRDIQTCEKREHTHPRCFSAFPTLIGSAFYFLSTPRNLSHMASGLLSILDRHSVNDQLNASNNPPVSSDLTFYSHLKTWTWPHLFSLMELIRKYFWTKHICCSMKIVEMANSKQFVKTMEWHAMLPICRYSFRYSTH